MATFQLACSRKEVGLGRDSNHYMDNEIQILISEIWLSWPTAIWFSKLNFIITLCHAISKNPLSLTGTWKLLPACQKSMARQGGRVLRRTGTDRKASQSISAFTACLVLLLLRLLFHLFFFFLNKYMYTQTLFICLLLNCLWLHWELWSIHFSRRNAAKTHLTRSKLDFIFLINDGLSSSPCLWASGEAYWLLLTFQLCLFFFWPRRKIWTSYFRSEVFKTCHIITCCLQNLFQLITNKLNTISSSFQLQSLLIPQTSNFKDVSF